MALRGLCVMCGEQCWCRALEGRKGTREIVGGDVEKIVSFGSRASASASITTCGINEEHLRSANAHNVW